MAESAEAIGDGIGAVDIARPYEPVSVPVSAQRPRDRIQRRERRQHRRTSPPSVLNGTTYSLRAAAVAAPLMVSDLVALLGSVVVASALVGAMMSGTIPVIKLFALLAVGLVAVKTALGLYPAIGVHPVAELMRSALASSLLVGSFILAGFLEGVSAPSLWVLVVTGLLILIATPVLRAVTRSTFARFSWWRQPLLVFDTGPAARDVSAYFVKNPGLGLKPVLVSPYLSETGSRGRSRVAYLASRHGALCAALPLEGASQPDLAELMCECANTFPHLLIIPDMMGLLKPSGAANLGGLVGLRAGKSLLLPLPRAAKRALDVTLSFVAGLVFLPFGLVIALAIKLTSTGPVLYAQERIGKDRKTFSAWKFRTMHSNADELLDECLAADPELREEWEKDHKLKKDPRVTPMGRFLRKTSLDELPQLWNVLRGEMSLVGPRPIVDAEVVKYGTEFGRYLTVPPGLTGLWQVSGRNRTTYEERIRLDTLYVENWSISLDIYILAKTVKTVVTGDGAY